MTLVNQLKDNSLKISIILYLIIIFFIIFSKPTFLFNDNGRSKHFGLGGNQKTIFPIWLICILLAILCYYFIILIGVVY
jgi:hypothetical protein